MSLTEKIIHPEVVKTTNSESIQRLVWQCRGSRINPKEVSDEVKKNAEAYYKTESYSKSIAILHKTIKGISINESSFEESYHHGLLTNLHILLPNTPIRCAIDAFNLHCAKTIESFNRNPISNLQGFCLTIETPNLFLPDLFEKICRSRQITRFFNPEILSMIMARYPNNIFGVISRKEIIFNKLRYRLDGLEITDSELAKAIASSSYTTADRIITKIAKDRRLSQVKLDTKEKNKPLDSKKNTSKKPTISNLEKLINFSQEKNQQVNQQLSGLINPLENVLESLKQQRINLEQNTTQNTPETAPIIILNESKSEVGESYLKIKEQPIVISNPIFFDSSLVNFIAKNFPNDYISKPIEIKRLTDRLTSRFSKKPESIITENLSLLKLISSQCPNLDKAIELIENIYKSFKETLPNKLYETNNYILFYLLLLNQRNPDQTTNQAIKLFDQLLIQYKDDEVISQVNQEHMEDLLKYALLQKRTNPITFIEQGKTIYESLLNKIKNKHLFGASLQEVLLNVSFFHQEKANVFIDGLIKRIEYYHQKYPNLSTETIALTIIRCPDDFIHKLEDQSVGKKIVIPEKTDLNYFLYKLQYEQNHTTNSAEKSLSQSRVSSLDTI